MKRVISVLLACAMAMSLCVTASAVGSMGNFKATRTYPGFSDVSSNSWYYSYVSDAYCYGLVNGNTKATYNPNGNMTVAEVLALACRIHNIYNGGTGVFTQGNPWYQVYVDYAKQNGFYDGSGSPTAPVTRLQFAHIIYAALPVSEYSAVNSTTSVPDTSDSIVLKLYQAGVITGDESKKFHPNDNIKRSEVAKIVLTVICPEKRAKDSGASTSASSSTTSTQSNPFSNVIDMVIKDGSYSSSENCYTYPLDLNSSSGTASFLYYADKQDLLLSALVSSGKSDSLATITFVKNGISTMQSDGSCSADFYVSYGISSKSDDICTGRVNLDSGEFTITNSTNSSQEFLALAKQAVKVDTLVWKYWKLSH